MNILRKITVTVACVLTGCAEPNVEVNTTEETRTVITFEQYRNNECGVDRVKYIRDDENELMEGNTWSVASIKAIDGRYYVYVLEITEEEEKKYTEGMEGVFFHGNFYPYCEFEYLIEFGKNPLH